MKIFGDLCIGLNDHDSHSVIERFSAIASRPWKRNNETERSANPAEGSSFDPFDLQSLPVYCFSHEAESDLLPSAHLWLQTRPSQLYVSNIVPPADGSLSKDQYNALLKEFNDDVVSPVKNDLRLSLEVSKTEVSLDDLVSPQTAKRLRSFSDNADRTSLHYLDERRLDDFIISHHNNGDNLDPELLQMWLIEQGWDTEAADKLVIDFERGRDLLKRYCALGD